MSNCVRKRARTVTTDISANYVYSQSDGDVVMVGFADHQYKTGAYVILQRVLSPTRDERLEDSDNIHIEVGDQSRSAYGGIEALELWPGQVLIALAPSTAAKIRSGSLLRIHFDAEQANAPVLRDVLRVLCGDYAKLTLHV